MAPATQHALALRFLEYGSRSDRAQHIEEGGVGRDLQVEIERAVHEDADATEEGRDGE